MGMAGDQHWTVDPNWPASQQSNCTGDCHARFLLAVEQGVMLGAQVRKNKACSRCHVILYTLLALGIEHLPRQARDKGHTQGKALKKDSQKRTFFLAQGWDDAYDKPLGNPLGPATYNAAGAIAI